MLVDKLTQTNIDVAVNAYQKSQESYQKAYDRNFDLHGKILKFFRESIENVETSTAANYLVSREWHLVIPSITDSYGNAKAPANLDEMIHLFTTLVLEPLETVHTFLQRLKEHIVNIQIVEEKTRENPDKIGYEDMLKSCFYTEEEWIEHHPNRRRVIGETQIINRILTALENSRLDRVRWDYNTQIRTPKERTIAALVDKMITGEASLKANEQVLTSVSSVTAVQKFGTDRYFCAYHSHGNQTATHSTKDCSAIRNGQAIKDPAGGKWYINKDTKRFFKQAANSGGAGESKKRKASSDSDEKDKKRVAKECSKCLKLNKEGANIPARVIKSHEASECKVDATRYQDTKASGSGPSKPETASWEKKINNLVNKVNQISIATKPGKSSGKKGKSSKASKEDTDDDDDDDEA